MKIRIDCSWRLQLILEVVHRGPGIEIITWRYMEKCFQREKHGKPVDTAAKSAKVNWQSWELSMSRSCLYPSCGAATMIRRFVAAICSWQDRSRQMAIRYSVLICLVVWTPLTLWKIWKSVGIIIPNIYIYNIWKKIPHRILGETLWP
jgi:hypothetical protein